MITGPTGVGKSFIASAIGNAACRADHSVRCFRLPQLTEELARCAALQKRSALLKQIARAHLLIIDDFGLTPLTEETVRDLLEILDDRYDRSSTLITSQLPSISGTTISAIAPSPTPSSIDWCTTLIESISKASPCENGSAR